MRVTLRILLWTVYVAIILANAFFTPLPWKIILTVPIGLGLGFAFWPLWRWIDDIHYARTYKKRINR